jgi:hypothetical protein
VALNSPSPGDYQSNDADHKVGIFVVSLRADLQVGTFLLFPRADLKGQPYCCTVEPTPLPNQFYIAKLENIAAILHRHLSSVAGAEPLPRRG